MSGLTLGQSLKFADLKTATNKLVDSGLFANVRYRYSWDGDNLDVIFEVEESKPPEPAPAPAAPKSLALGKIAFSGLKRCNGAVFNVEYVRNFVKKMLDDRGGRTPRVLIQPDRSKQIANVLFTF